MNCTGFPTTLVCDWPWGLLSTEAKDVAGGSESDRFTEYKYGDSNEKTQQTNKTVKLYTDGSGGPLEQTAYDYHLQGRMATVTIDSNGDGTPETQLAYEYNDHGIRTAQTKTTDGNADGDFVDPEDASERTDYLIDEHNPTGYAQVLEEWIDGTLAKTYTIGHDVFAEAAAAGIVRRLLKDGHGSTRMLVDAAGLPLSGQIYRFDAYGNAIGFDPALALTTLLYNSEQFDSRTGLSYLRARYYDPNTGRFNRLDPFAGNMQDPQSLHKYLFVHADPIGRIDPTGEFSLGKLALTVGIISGMAGAFHGAIIGARDGALSSVRGAVLGSAIGFAAGFSLVYGAGAAAALGVGAAGLFGYTIAFPTAVHAILIAAQVGVTGLVIKNLTEARDGYELAASVSDLIFIMVGWALLLGRPSFGVPAQEGYTGRLYVGKGKAQKTGLFDLVEGDVTLDMNPAANPDIVAHISTVDPATVKGSPFNEVILERFPYPNGT